MSKQQVSKFSGLFNLIVKLKWAIPVIALVLAILSVVLAMERRKTLLRLAIGVALMTMLLLAGLSLGRITFLNQASGGGFNTQAAAAVWDTVLRFLKTDLRWTLLIFGAGRLRRLAGRTGPLRRVDPLDRRQGRPLGGARRPTSCPSGAGRAAAESGRVRRSGGWILEHLSGLRIVGVVVAGLFLVFGGNLTGWSLLVIVIVLAVYLGLLQLVAAWARKVSDRSAATRPSPPAPVPATAQRALRVDAVDGTRRKGPCVPVRRRRLAAHCRHGRDHGDSGVGRVVRGRIRRLVHAVAPAGWPPPSSGSRSAPPCGARRAPDADERGHTLYVAPSRPERCAAATILPAALGAPSPFLWGALSRHP